jgi:hypothetical protein
VRLILVDKESTLVVFVEAQLVVEKNLGDDFLEMLV